MRDRRGLTALHVHTSGVQARQTVKLSVYDAPLGPTTAPRLLRTVHVAERAVPAVLAEFAAEASAHGIPFTLGGKHAEQLARTARLPAGLRLSVRATPGIARGRRRR
jgi:hypothetical protein